MVPLSLLELALRLARRTAVAGAIAKYLADRGGDDAADGGVEFGRVAVNISSAQFRSGRLAEELRHPGADRIRYVADAFRAGWSLERVGGEHSRAPSAKFDEAAWVGWRLAEWLPLEATERLALLQLADPHERLQQLVERLPDFQAE